MGIAREIVVEESAEALATSVAARAVSTLAQAQTERGYATLVLTGGSILEAVFSALAVAPVPDGFDWSRVDVYWGDERFVPTGSPDRNDGPVQRLLLDPLGFDPARVHPMPTSDGPDGDDVQAAAVRYAQLLAGAVDPRHRHADDVPAFDIALIGVGPDGHCCSLFPMQPGVHEERLSVIAVTDSPKPPPTRLSLTFRSLAAADQVWVIASGAGKADAVSEALGGADRVKIPSAGALGHDRTIWLLDRDAAADLPASADATPAT